MLRLPDLRLLDKNYRNSKTQLSIRISCNHYRYDKIKYRLINCFTVRMKIFQSIFIHKNKFVLNDKT
jgi:hypothetical protein